MTLLVTRGDHTDTAECDLCTLPSMAPLYRLRGDRKTVLICASCMATIRREVPFLT